MLKPRKRITRKEIKQDKLVTVYFKVNEWLGENSKIVTAGFAAVVIIFTAAFLYSSHKSANEDKASQELAVAERLFEDSQYRDAIDKLNVLVDNYSGTKSGRIEDSQYRDAIDKLNVLVDNYSGTKSGRIGKFFLASAHYNLGEYGLAEVNFRNFLSKPIDDPLLVSSAMNGVAASLEQQDKFTEAAKQYENAAKKYPQEIYASSALFNAARCYQKAENNQKAVILLEEILKEYPKSEEVEKAKMQLAILAQKNPNVDVINIEP